MKNLCDWYLFTFSLLAEEYKSCNWQWILLISFSFLIQNLTIIIISLLSLLSLYKVLFLYRLRPGGFTLVSSIFSRVLVKPNHRFILPPSLLTLDKARSASGRLVSASRPRLVMLGVTVTLTVTPAVRITVTPTVTQTESQRVPWAATCHLTPHPAHAQNAPVHSGKTHDLSVWSLPEQGD